MAVSDSPSDALAILIDADNANPAIVKGLIGEVAKFGRASVRRIYGDWTSDRLKSWKAALLEHSIQPIQQFAYTSGKNATDSAMIIDAMDLLYAGNLDGFCIVSSDSDFTRLASRLRESGKAVYGFGEQKTPRPFVSACDRFIYTEIFTQVEGKAPVRRAASDLERDRAFVQLVGGAVDAATDDSGWAHLGAVGSNLTKNEPDFDSRNYGYSKLSDLLEASKLFEVKRQDQMVRVRRIRRIP
ncbi:MAG: NYN domain-containing protein [Steroidobacteraceae bacterium]